jgi:FxsC-like protein
VLTRLADRIVGAATTCPLGPSAAVSLPAPSVNAPVAFAIAVVARTAGDAPAGRLAGCYGERPSLWCPFAGVHGFPAAQFAADIAERLGLLSRIVDVDEAEPVFDRMPGLLLVDPWIAADDQRLGQLMAMAGWLPDWVIPVVVADPGDPKFAGSGAEVLDQTVTALRTACPQATLVRGPDEFTQRLPILIAQARRTQLRTWKFLPTPG